MTAFQDIDNLNPTPTALITGADKVPFYNTSDAKAYAMTMDQLQTWVLAGGTIDPTFDDVTCDTLVTTGNVGIGTASPVAKLEVVGNYRQKSLVGNSNGFNLTIDSATDVVTASNFYNAALVFATNNTERVRIDAAGNLGLGVTPSAWSASFKALQVSNASLWSSGGSNALIGANYYHDGTNRRYISTAAATEYGQSGGSHIWYTAPSGTAGTAITFTQAMTLDASGNLGLGVTPSAWSSGKAVEVGANGTAIWSVSAVDAYWTQGAYFNTSFRYSHTGSGGVSAYQQSSGTHKWYIAAGGTAGNAISFTQAMTLDANGDLALGRTGVSTIGSGYRTVDMDGTNGAGLSLRTGGTQTGFVYTSSGGVAIEASGSRVVDVSANGAVRCRIKANGQVRFIPLAADPGGAETGDVYYNSGTNKLKVYNGTAWVDLH